MKNFLTEAGNIHLSYYVEAATFLNINYEIIAEKLMARFEYKNKHWFIINTVTPLVNSPGKTIASRKNLTNIILQKSGISVPRQATLTTIDDAYDFYKNHEGVVVKPTEGLGGKGVSILPSSLKEVKQAFIYAKQNSIKPNVLIEEYIKGDHFRLLTLDDKVIGVIKRLPPTIKADGKTSIQNLILTKNPKVPVDNETMKVLKQQSLSLDSIPNKDKEILLRNNTNLTTGGRTEEFSKYIHPYYEEIAVKTIKAIGIKLGGVDLITEDITKPAKYAINEINYNPGLRIHYQVDKGKKVKVAIPIMKYIRDNQI